jgi:hypothetical protein
MGCLGEEQIRADYCTFAAGQCDVVAGQYYEVGKAAGSTKQDCISCRKFAEIAADTRVEWARNPPSI